MAGGVVRRSVLVAGMSMAFALAATSCDPTYVYEVSNRCPSRMLVGTDDVPEPVDPDEFEWLEPGEAGAGRQTLDDTRTLYVWVKSSEDSDPVRSEFVIDAPAKGSDRVVEISGDMCP